MLNPITSDNFDLEPTKVVWKFLGRFKHLNVSAGYIFIKSEDSGVEIVDDWNDTTFHNDFSPYLSIA